MRTRHLFPALLGAALLFGCGSTAVTSSGSPTAGNTGGTSANTTAGNTSGGSSSTSTSSGGASGSSGTSGTSGTTADGGQGCGLRTCASANANCGPIGDGCGNIIQCGDCGAHDFCGGGGPSRCGPYPCTPLSCADVGADCGVISDGCGGTVSCGTGTCPANTFCGGGGANKCGSGAYVDGGSSTCVPKTCADVGANCGQVADGCGGLTPDCGSCSGQDICGGSGVPNQCGSSNRPDAGLACTNLCLQQQSCSSGTTSISGKVYAPNGVDPLYNALVYVPNGTVQAFTPGVTCMTCDNQVSGQPLVATNTASDGSFTLTNMPVGQNIPLVIQLGRWRRQVVIPSVAACQDNPLTSDLTRLPRNKTEGDIPLTAMVTGSVDALECVLRKIGIDDAEFTNPGGTGRIQFYLAPSESGGNGPGAAIDSNTPDGDNLVDSTAQLNQYDMVLFACEGGPYAKDPTQLGNVLNYANLGGRVFATHYSYEWLDTPQTWDSVDNWAPGSGTGSTETGLIDTSFPKGQAFSQWLDAVGASTSPGSNQITINQWRWDANAVVAPTQQWITLPNQSDAVEHLTFNTPVGTPADQQCGRVLFSDFHVTDASTDPSQYFPSYCSTGALTAQEHVLEFMLFDLASCITPDQPPPPTCTRLSCADQNIGCGLAGDGCGGTQDCGSCSGGQTCGGGGVASQCGTPSCTPLSCADQGIVCGTAGDGCGGTITCASCSGGEFCGGGGTPNQCGSPGTCTPTTCADQGANCGPIADGCGGTLDCGTCPSGQQCGMGGANVCGGFQ